MDADDGRLRLPGRGDTFAPEAIRLRPSEAEGILALCRAELAAYKAPRAIQFVADLPKTSTGKIMRRELSKLDA